MSPSDTTARAVAESVVDPELPMLTLADLGVLRDVTVTDGDVVVSLTPTYSGCPAMTEMGRDVATRLRSAGFRSVEVRTVLTPPWTSDWITDEGRRKLAEAGISPPGPAPAGSLPVGLSATRRGVRCPHCGSLDTELRSVFGATACRALYRCAACSEPFEHVKEI